MLEFSQPKRIFLSLLLIVGVILALPSLLPARMVGSLPDFLPKQTINLGLDLAGGSHILLEADPAEVRAQQLESMEENVRSALRGAEDVEYGEISRTGGVLGFTVADQSQVDAAREAVQGLTTGAGLTGQRDWTIRVVDGTRLLMGPSDAGIARNLDDAMDTATDVIRRRIDELGTREPTIIRQGDERIVVQVPGLDDPQALKDLLGQTAALEFKLVDYENPPEDTAAGNARIGSQVFPFEDGTGNIAVRRLGGIDGENLTGAQQSFDQDNQPVVVIQFDTVGGRRFAKLTQENVNRQFAIILDDEVISAPVINEPILGGSSQISGNFTVDSANNLAIALRSGALPVDLTIVEERTVGPDLGADSIAAGGLAALVATIAVLAFMMLTYGRFGVYANMALIINLLLILGIMSLFGATLTLPGIAGFVLTVGSAVDANVLINERIREEQRRGRRVIQAIEVGYKEASRAIFDANLTNVIAAVLLFLFGSGPIRGFAVVLVIGIITSVFTAVTITRMWVAGWVRRNRPTELHI